MDRGGGSWGTGGGRQAGETDKKQKKRGVRARIWTECRVRGKGECRAIRTGQGHKKDRPRP